MYPGAYLLVYQHLMQIIIECLLGWNKNEQKGEGGVFGEIKACARTDGE